MFDDEVIFDDLPQEKKLKQIPELVKPIINFFKKSSCYDLMPGSSKIIVFDVDSKVKDAFHIAVETSIF